MFRRLKNLMQRLDLTEEQVCRILESHAIKKEPAVKKEEKPRQTFSTGENK